MAFELIHITLNKKLSFISGTVQKMKFSVMDFFCNCDQIDM